MLIILFASMFLFILLGMEISFVLIMSPLLLIGLSHVTGDFAIPFEVVPQQLFGGAESFSFTAIPLFILAGEIMNRGGITNRLVEFVQKMVGHFHGGVAQTAVGMNIVMAGISGSAVADCTATGSVLIPAMKKEGYSAEKSAAIIASASTIGPIIPPSIPLIIIGSMAGISIGKLFLAGLVPGLLMGLGLMVYLYFYAKAKGMKRQEKTGARGRLNATAHALLPLGMPIIVLGSIIFGFASPTESAVLGVLYSLVVSGLIYRTLNMKALFEIFTNTAVSSGAIMITVAAGALFGWVATYHYIADVFESILFGISTNPLIILLLINLILLILGMVLETIPIILLMAPILFPVTQSVGIDPIHMGIIVTVNLMIGLITPPIGLHLFITSSIARTSIYSVIRASFPFLVVLLMILGLITFVPQITLLLPGMMN